MNIVLTEPLFTWSIALANAWPTSSGVNFINFILSFLTMSLATESSPLQEEKLLHMPGLIILHTSFLAPTRSHPHQPVCLQLPTQEPAAIAPKLQHVRSNFLSELSVKIAPNVAA